SLSAQGQGWRPESRTWGRGRLLPCWLTPSASAVGFSGEAPGRSGGGHLTTILRLFHCVNELLAQCELGNGGRQSPPTPPLLLTPQLLHSVLLAQRATVEQLAGHQTLQGLPEATEDKKGSGSGAPRLGSLPAACQLGPCCLLGSPQDKLPSLAPFTPPLLPSLPSNWTRLSGPFLPSVPPEQQFPGSSKPDTVLPGPGCPPVTRPFPGLPLLAGLGQGAGERLRLWPLRSQGLEVKPHPMMGAKGRLDPREGFSSDIHGPKTRDKSPVSPPAGELQGSVALGSSLGGEKMGGGGPPNSIPPLVHFLSGFAPCPAWKRV
uniref:Uncharacterized protein n=1 Tax=Ailuropoda melanoleuca TaxID=9646 RepID=A0A7N5KJK2_AILME